MANVNAAQADPDESEDADDSESESGEPRQIGPRLDPDLAEDFENAIRRQHGKYKGRLSDEVTIAIKLYLGKLINENPEWIDEAEGDELERYKKYAKRFQQASKSAPMDDNVANELEQLREEVQSINRTSTNLLSQILTQVNEQENSID